MYIKKVKYPITHWLLILACSGLLLLSNNTKPIYNFRTSVTKTKLFFINSVFGVINWSRSVYENFTNTKTSKVDELQQKIIALNNQLDRLNYLEIENNKLKSLFNSSSVSGNNRFIFANIINDISRLTMSRELFLNVGSNANTEVGDVVIGEKGLVGLINEVHENWSSIKKITDMNFFISVSFAPSGISAILKGNGVNKLIIYLIDQQKEIPSGEVAYTDGSDNNFPAGIRVGRLENNCVSQEHNIIPANNVCIMKFNKFIKQ